MDTKYVLAILSMIILLTLTACEMPQDDATGEATTVSTTFCKDSDGGQNYEVKGTACARGCKTDFCADEKTLREIYCVSMTQKGQKPYVCPNGCKDGACVKVLPPFTMAVSDKSPVSDNKLMVSVLSNLRMKGYTQINAAKLFSEVNGLDLDNKVTLAIYNGQAYIIVGVSSPPSHTKFATDIGKILSAMGVKYTAILSSDVKNRDLNLLFASCTDSDGGVNYNIKGTCFDSIQKMPYTDYCNEQNPGGLAEVSCTYVTPGTSSPQLEGNTVCVYTGHQCPNGCKDGACIQGTGKMTLKIAGVTGNKTVYSAKENITLTVKGVKSDGTPASNTEGYNVQYYTYDLKNAGEFLSEYIKSGNFNGAYSSGYWNLPYWAPSNPGEYYTEIVLYCSNPNAKCYSDVGDTPDTEARMNVYFSVSELQCRDSDGGPKYDMKGSTSYGSVTAADQCNNAGQFGSSPKILAEYYCDPGNVIDGTIKFPTGVIEGQLYECPNGCKDGACITNIPISENCTDSDNGKSYYSQGSVEYNGNRAQDICNTFAGICPSAGGCGTGDYLIEWVCDPNGYKDQNSSFTTQGYAPVFVKCGNGCRDGKCYYPGFYMTTNKQKYTPSETISLTIRPVTPGSAKVDLYVQPYKGYGSASGVKILKDVVVEGSKTVQIVIPSYPQIFDETDYYLLKLCDAGAECTGGINTNSAPVSVTK